jgi:hypothetical protein
MFDHCLVLAVNLACPYEGHRRVCPDDHPFLSAGDAILIPKTDAARGQDFGEQATTIGDLVTSLSRLERAKLAVGELAHVDRPSMLPPSVKHNSMMGAAMGAGC